jgi:predicted homoserine dehydrogenase-like protein
MNLFKLLQQRRAEGRPVRVGLIGAGKFGTMFLAQARRTPGLVVAAVADLDRSRAERALETAGWQDGTAEVSCQVTEDAETLIARSDLEVVIEATGHPAAGIRHARLAVREGKHLVMVTVEADVLAGPLLAREARRAGLVYSLAYGDQPALIAEMVDWARAAGFPVVAAGKGTKYLPAYHASTPETVWSHYGLTPEAAAAGGMNPQMFNSFLDGTKSAIEMAAVANACDLAVPSDGLSFPPCGVDDLAGRLIPRAAGGCLEHSGQVEVVSSLDRQGREVAGDLRWGVYVVFEAPSDYAARCFGEYGLKTDASGRYTAMYKPYHLIGLELGISVLSAALRGEATGAPEAFRGDVASVAKRDLAAGERLDGEGGFTVWGKLLPAEDSLSLDALPIGLAQGVTLRRGLKAGEVLRRADVDLDEKDATIACRDEMESHFGPEG